MTWLEDDTQPMGPVTDAAGCGMSAPPQASWPALTRKVRVGPPVPALDPARRPSVSVVVSCFNYGHFLAASVGSALAQPGVELDVIVVDDCSTDDSAALADALAVADQRVRVLRRDRNGGPAVAFNTGLDSATGQYLVRLDADDLLAPGSLRRAVALAEAFPFVGLVYGHPVHFTGSEPPHSRADTVRGWSVWPGVEWLAERCRRGVNCITSPEAMVRTDVARRIGGLNPRLQHTHDMEWWLRLAAVSDVGRVDGPDQAFHRDHAASRSVTVCAGALLDLQERKLAFDAVFAGPGSRLAMGRDLHAMAGRALAAEALDRACRAYERGRADTDPVDELVAFAFKADPAAERRPQWRALQRRRRAGVSAARVRPRFLPTTVLRRAREEIAHRRWERTGV
jgi:glycosyltransferase involved in cell wall biosynthesis